MTQTQAKSTPHQLRVALSQFHSGQSVYPVVTAIAANFYSADCHVELYWHDRSDGGRLRPATFAGTRQEAEAWLTRQGVHLDAQGIY